VVGSLYLLRPGTQKGPNEEAREPSSEEPKRVHSSPEHEDGTGSLPASSHSIDSVDAIEPVHTTTHTTATRTATINSEDVPSKLLHTTTTRSSKHPDRGKRRQVAKSLASISTYIGTAARDRFDDTAFKTGEALDFPEVPGESNRNPNLSQIRQTYNNRSSSFNGSIRSGVEGRASSTRAASPSPLRRVETGIFQPERISSERYNNYPSTPADTTRGRPARRRATLEVPVAAHFGHSRNNLSTSSAASNTSDPRDQGSPTIVISSDSMIPIPASVHSPTSNPSSPLSQEHPSTPPPS
jgi:hypothetical protein